jgi:hypothetical protein
MMQLSNRPASCVYTLDAASVCVPTPMFVGPHLLFLFHCKLVQVTFLPLESFVFAAVVGDL